MLVTAIDDEGDQQGMTKQEVRDQLVTLFLAGHDTTSNMLTWTFALIYMAQHDPRWFPEPEAFRPERFAADAEAQLPRSAYLPFGAGPRACIGKSFAMMEAKILLATIARKFRFERSPGHKLQMKARITLMPRHGLAGVLRQR